MKNWQEIWDSHSDIFSAQIEQECSTERRKDWRLPAQFRYFSGGDTTLRVGVITSEVLPKEDEFLLAGLMLAHRLSNGARAVIYFIAPDFSPFFTRALSMIGGVISAKAVYWKDKLTPSLYLIPEPEAKIKKKLALGERRPEWQKWAHLLDPVAQNQLNIVKQFFLGLAERRVTYLIKQQQIHFMWGSFEIAEIRRKGKKFELISKAKWERDPNIAKTFQKAGWVDAAGALNSEFCDAVYLMIACLEEKEKNCALKPKEQLALWLNHGAGILSTAWGKHWEWPWVPKERAENWVHDLSQWFYFEGDGRLSVVCPILEKPMMLASQSILLRSVLEHSDLLCPEKAQTEGSCWDGKIHWLTQPNLEAELRLWLTWLKVPEKFQIWTLPEDWQKEGLKQLSSRNISCC